MRRAMDAEPIRVLAGVGAARGVMSARAADREGAGRAMCSGSGATSSSDGTGNFTPATGKPPGAHKRSRRCVHTPACHVAMTSSSARSQAVGSPTSSTSSLSRTASAPSGSKTESVAWPSGARPIWSRTARTRSLGSQRRGAPVVVDVVAGVAVGMVAW